MGKSRAEETDFNSDRICCHTFRPVYITMYPHNGGELETAQHIAGHASANTTRIYDHRDKKVAQDEIERVRI